MKCRNIIRVNCVYKECTEFVYIYQAMGSCLNSFCNFKWLCANILRLVEWAVSEWLLLNTKWAIFQPYHGQNKLHLMRWWCPLCTRPMCLAHWNDSQWVDISLHYEWLQANKSLFLLLNAACLVEKQQILVWRQLESNR